MIEFDDLLLKKLDELERRVNAGLPQLAARAESEGLGYAVESLNRGIYSTIPGAYQRTGDLLRDTFTKGRATRNTVTLRVWSVSPYAGIIEHGAMPNTLTDAQLLQYAETRGGNNAPLYFGRTGQAYTRPQPFILSTAVWAKYRLLAWFDELQASAWR